MRKLFVLSLTAVWLTGAALGCRHAGGGDCGCDGGHGTTYSQATPALGLDPVKTASRTATETPGPSIERVVGKQP